MTTRPIPFNGEMVRAILSGAKTETRRAVKPQPPAHLGGPDAASDGWRWWQVATSFSAEVWPGWGRPMRCPYGEVGDQLWVRERALVLAVYEDVVRVRYEADGAESDWLPFPDRLKPVAVGRCIANGCHREAARIHLEITDVAVERLQDINEAGARAEGVESSAEWRDAIETTAGQMRTAARLIEGEMCIEGFARLWDSLAKPGSRWSDNPWVFVVRFRVLQ